jgi:hypothetical protein
MRLFVESSFADSDRCCAGYTGCPHGDDQSPFSSLPVCTTWMSSQTADHMAVMPWGSQQGKVCLRVGSSLQEAASTASTRPETHRQQLRILAALLIGVTAYRRCSGRLRQWNEPKQTKVATDVASFCRAGGQPCPTFDPKSMGSKSSTEVS